MIKSELSTVIDAPPEKVFSRLDDPKNRVEEFPGVLEVKDITGEGVGKQFRLVYKMFGMRFETEFTRTEYVLNERIASKVKGGITGKNLVTMEPHNGGTKMTYTVEYTVPIPLVGKIAEKLLKKQNEREAEVFLSNLKARLEAGE